MMPMLVAMASGELLSPKHTGQASAARGTASQQHQDDEGFSHIVSLD